jgi:hypothetical protein
MGERRERRLVLVVTNGEKTEPNYFNAFKTLLPKGTLTLDVEFHEGSQRQVVERAVTKHGEAKYDEVWAVLDTEDLDLDSNSFPAALALAEENGGIKIVYSNRQIEVWFLFHFPQGRAITKSMQRDKTMKKLNECLFSAGINDGYKKSRRIFNILLHCGEEQAAIDHAEGILKKANEKFPNEAWQYNPSTTVHHLVKRLREMVEPK